MDQDLEVVGDIVEDINVDEKIEELSNTLNHGRRNLAEERRILRELKVMQRKKKHHDHPVKPTTFQRPRWNSKECIQQRILVSKGRYSSLCPRNLSKTHISIVP